MSSISLYMDLHAIAGRAVALLCILHLFLTLAYPHVDSTLATASTRAGRYCSFGGSRRLGRVVSEFSWRLDGERAAMSGVVYE